MCIRMANYDVDACLLCDELWSKNPLSHQLNLWDDPVNKVIFESKHFVVLRDISPIIPGHCLILTKKHFTSFSRLPNNWWTELGNIKKKAIPVIASRFGDPFLFEHGSVSGKMKVGACIEHAHIHLIPAYVSVTDSLSDYTNAPLQCSQISMPEVFTGVKASYLYYEDQNGYGCIIENPRQPVPQQIIRRIVAKKYKIADWDWKKVLYKRYMLV